MKTQYISIILTLCIILSSVTLLSHAGGGVQTIQLDLNKDSYFPGDVMSINGKLWLVNATQVTIGLEKNHALITMTENVTVSKNETFATSFTIPKDMDAKSWSIVVKANDGTLIQDLDFHPPLLTLLQQIKSGIPIPDITCSNGLYLGVKSPSRDLVCLKAGTISKLASRGFFFGIDANKNEVNYATILIPPGSENQVSTNSYSPSVVTIEIGVNNTVRWVDQSDTADTIVSDMPLIQNGKSFGSDGVIKPGESYKFTFTEPGTFTYHTDPHPWMKGTIIVLPRINTNSHTSVGENTTLPVSFEPCDTPYPKSNTGVAVLYMPVNSTGKICVQYSNSNPPQSTGLRIFEAHHIDDDTPDITSYATHDKIQTGNSTIVYTVKTTNHVGFYGLTIFCVGMPFAVGSDNTSTFVQGDFPWLGGTYYCPAQLYNYHIVGLSGIGIKYMPYH